MNQVNLIGRITDDITLRYTPNNQTAVTNFNIAINRGKDRDGNDRGADFPRIVAYGKQAENLERYSGKGKLIAVSGHIKTGSYKTKEGNTVYTSDVEAERIEFLEWNDKAQNKPKSEETEESGTFYTGGEQTGFAAIDTEIPF